MPEICVSLQCYILIGIAMFNSDFKISNSNVENCPAIFNLKPNEMKSIRNRINTDGLYDGFSVGFSLKNVIFEGIDNQKFIN